MKIPKELSAYMAAIGRKGGRKGRGVAKQKAGALGGKASAAARKKRALEKA